jgi:hypothetical protein
MISGNPIDSEICGPRPWWWQCRFRAAQADTVHGLAEPVPGLGLLMASREAPISSTSNRSRTPMPGHLHGGVQAGLPAQGGQQGIGTLFFDDLGYGFGVTGSM